jgi:hypothetical protein
MPSGFLFTISPGRPKQNWQVLTIQNGDPNKNFSRSLFGFTSGPCSDCSDCNFAISTIHSGRLQ